MRKGWQKFDDTFPVFTKDKSVIENAGLYYKSYKRAMSAGKKAIEKYSYVAAYKIEDEDGNVLIDTLKFSYKNESMKDESLKINEVTTQKIEIEDDNHILDAFLLDEAKDTKNKYTIRMDITMNKKMTYEEAELIIFNALRSAGMIAHKGGIY